ncbi:hypothetical protein MMC25_006709 [Agyrium rufum]|nr:hypothetical protein [Agyrium rufum]
MKEDGPSNAPNIAGIEIERMQQQAEVRSAADDWTGIGDQATRRKLQNRLNQRIYSNLKLALPLDYGRGSCRADWMTRYYLGQRRKAPSSSKAFIASNGFHANSLDLLCPPTTDDARAHDPAIAFATIQTKTVTRSSVFTHRSSLPELVVSKLSSRSLTLARRTQAHLEAMSAHFEKIARQNFTMGSPRVDQLLTLIQFNVFRALISNTRSLGWTTDWLDHPDLNSPWTDSHGPETLFCPEALRPSRIQRSVEHHPWLDLWPIPRLRDNIILAGDSFDEYRLCNHLVEFEGVPHEQTGLVVWGEPWDPKNVSIK